MPLTTMPNQEQLQQIREGAELQNYRPYIEKDLDKMKQAVVNHVMMLLQKNELTPELALMKWMEYVSFIRLGQNIGKKITVGISLGEKIPQELK